MILQFVITSLIITVSLVIIKAVQILDSHLKAKRELLNGILEEHRQLARERDVLLVALYNYNKRAARRALQLIDPQWEETLLKLAPHGRRGAASVDEDEDGDESPVNLDLPENVIGPAA